MDRASKILSRVPPPTRSGTTQTAASATCGRTSATVPVTRTSAAFAAARSRALGFRPTTVSDTPGTARRIAGSTASRNCSTASSFGYQSIDPVKTSRCGSSGAASGAKYDVSTPVGTA